MDITPLFEPTSSRTAIINILSEKFPLSAKELFYSVKKIGFTITYQAIHKLLKSMIKDSIVVKVDARYQLNKDWISKIKYFTEKTQKIYQSKYNIDISNYNFNKPLEVKFDIQYTMGIFFLDLLGRYSKINEGKIARAFCHWSFMYFVLPFDYKRTKTIIEEYNFNIVSNQQYEIDKWISNIWQSMGYKTYFYCGPLLPFDVTIVNNVIFEIHWPVDFLNYVKEYYQTPLNRLNIEEFFDIILNKKVSIKFVVKKDKEEADNHIKRIKMMIK